MMIGRGLLEKIDANLRRNEPPWPETGDDHGTTLIATKAGFDAIGIEPAVTQAMPGLRKPQKGA